MKYLNNSEFTRHKKEILNFKLIYLHIHKRKFKFLKKHLNITLLIDNFVSTK